MHQHLVYSYSNKIQKIYLSIIKPRISCRYNYSISYFLDFKSSRKIISFQPLSLLNRWKDLVADSEVCSCIVKSEAFKAATNPFAVCNLLLQMHRQKKIKITDPPENSQMRFGFYKSALLFIGKYYNLNVVYTYSFL